MWQSEEAQRCPNCHTYPWEWEDDPQAYAWGFHYCRGCVDADAGSEAMNRERQQAAANPNLNRDGWSVRLFPKGVDDDAD